ncbi:unnamed protein product [Effrenium voratum]|uniref:Uncharacterized protein n=1 Tax=Effrenium voratum TaxID=2562239 RepID=A0AA36J5I4_9DINO|nr:unnamed protein product [Effrenium voratum]
MQVFDASLLNSRRPSQTRSYFSVPEKLKLESRPASRGQSRGLAARWRAAGAGAAFGRCPCCGAEASASTRVPSSAESATCASANDAGDTSAGAGVRRSLAKEFEEVSEKKEEEAPKVEVKAPAKGKGKGSPPPPPPRERSKAPSARPRRPYARWIEWRALAPEKLQHTVFEGLTGGPDFVDLNSLAAHFGASARLTPGQPPAQAQEVEILSQRRAQNMLIAFRRQPLSRELVAALESFDLEHLQLSTDALELLCGAMPTAEESKQLLAYRGDICKLRRLEQELLPLAKLSPCARQRLKLLLLHRRLREAKEELAAPLADLLAAYRQLTQSRAFRHVLLHLLRLGNALNGDIASGFSLECLPRLALCKSTAAPKLCLLHLLVAQLAAEDPASVSGFLAEVAQPAKLAASLPLGALAQEVGLLAQEALGAKQCLREAFPAFDLPKEFFIGDGEESPCTEHVTPGDVRQVLREVYTRVAKQAPLPLRRLAESAFQDTAELQARLADARDEAAAAMAFFAYENGAAASQNPLIDAKSTEFFQILKCFTEAFEQCVRTSGSSHESCEAQDLWKSPSLARQCHGGIAQSAEMEQENGPGWRPAELDLGFRTQDVASALAEAQGDEDEALAALKRKMVSQPAAEEEKKRRKGDLEVEGYSCRAQGSKLILHLPQVDMLGPVVGELRNGSLSLEVDEWVQELYHASVPREPCPVHFDAAGADKALAEQRPWLWENFANAREVAEAHGEMEELLRQKVLTTANSDTTGTQKARSDKVAFLELADEKPAVCLELLRRVEAAVSALSWSDGGPLLCPKFGMAAVYDGGGSYYAAHRDNEHTGHAERQWVNFRSLTAVIYVNPSGFESAEDGGQLRCHLGAELKDLTGATASKVQDISPRGGRAVLFPSRSVLHEVLPSFRRRFALSLWFVSPRAGQD